ncbi:hypothetical protein ACVIIV_005326 [Bradyrhizobium sp. USDA 4354]
MIILPPAKKRTDQRHGSAAKPRVFLSHSSKDKSAARKLAGRLSELDFEVWFDEWQIAVGDSIVEKVFSALSASDTLVVLLSRASVRSRWVTEELNSSVMRQLSDGGIRVLPVLCETCAVPASLKHIKYADFRKRKGYFDLVEALQPAAGLWRDLEGIFDQFCLEIEKLRRRKIANSADVERLYGFLDDASILRTRIELRDSPQALEVANFFARLSFLESRGINTTSPAFATLANRAFLGRHELSKRTRQIGYLFSEYRSRTQKSPTRTGLSSFLSDLQLLMEDFCSRNCQRQSRSRRR